MEDNTEYLKSLAEEEKRRKASDLEAQRTQALTEVEREQAKVMPVFTQQKQQANVQSQIGAKNFAEFLARRGQTSAGISTQAEMSRQNALANTIGGITASENQALQGFGQQRADIGTQYTTNLARAYGDIEGQLNTNLYNEKLRQEDLARQQAAAESQAQARAERQAYEDAIAAQQYEDKMRQQAFENAMAVKNYNRLLANETPKEQHIVGSIRKVNNKLQVWNGTEWTDIKYATDKTGNITPAVKNSKTYKLNQLGYGLSNQTITVDKGKGKATYGIWVKDDIPYIVRNDVIIPYFAGINSNVIEALGSGKSTLSDNMLTALMGGEATLSSKEQKTLKDWGY